MVIFKLKNISLSIGKNVELVLSTSNQLMIYILFSLSRIVTISWKHIYYARMCLNATFYLEIQCLINIIYCNFAFYSEDLENVSDRNLTIASALATVLSKTFQLKSPGIQSHIEKCPTFVSKEKRPKIFGHRNKKTVQLQGHHFEIKHYYQHTVCTHSQQMIWGIGPQGYKCSRKL